MERTLATRNCERCGRQYDMSVYGKVCPFCTTYTNGSSARQREIPCVYGPPPLANSYEVLYGPPPIQDPIRMPTLYGPPPPHKRGCTCLIISLVVGAILGGIIVWLFVDCSHIKQPTVYGPPPVDTIASPIDALN